jgi:hypothetical protein
VTSIPTTTSAAAASNCQPSQLHFSLVKFGQAANQPAAYFQYTNTSGATCTLDGYPGLQPYTSSGQAIGNATGRGGSMLISDPGPHLVSLTPGSAAYFGYAWQDGIQPTGSTVGCMNTATAQSAPPNDFTALTTPAQLPGVCPVGATVTAVGLAAAFAASSEQP